MGIFDLFKKQDENKQNETSTDLQATTNMEPVAREKETSLLDQIVRDHETDLTKSKTISIPITELSSLGTAVSEMVPSFRQITQKFSMQPGDLYKVANAPAGSTLKVAKNGNFWGAFKTAEGKSKFAQLQKADPMEVTSSVTQAVNPATFMVAAALYSIDQKLDKIAEVQKQILTFLETEKESQIEADVKMLGSTLKELKMNWENETFVQGHYKLALDIKRNAEKDLQAYQKEIGSIKDKTDPLVLNASVNSTLKTLVKKFGYYRLSLYLFAISSYIEVLLLREYSEEHIMKVKKDIEERTLSYRKLYASCSEYMEKMAGDAVEVNVLKGLGAAGKMLGSFIGSIPLIKDSPVDELLKDGGSALEKNAKGMEKETLKAFAAVSNPGTGLFVDKMDDLNLIANHTSKVCMDDKNIYLVAT